MGKIERRRTTSLRGTLITLRFIRTPQDERYTSRNENV